MVTSRQAESEGYQSHGFHLMTCLLDANLVSPGRDIWNVFLQNFCRPTQSSCLLLSSVIKSVGLDESYYCRNMLNQSINVAANNNHNSSVNHRLGRQEHEQQFLLRKSLVEWLLTSEMLIFNSGDPIPDHKSQPSPQIVSLLCMALIHQDSTEILRMRSKDAQQKKKLSKYIDDKYTSSLDIKNLPAPSREIKSRSCYDLPIPSSFSHAQELELFYLNLTFDLESESGSASTQEGPSKTDMFSNLEMRSLAETSVSEKSFVNDNGCNPLVPSVAGYFVAVMNNTASNFTDLMSVDVRFCFFTLNFVKGFITKGHLFDLS